MFRKYFRKASIVTVVATLLVASFVMVGCQKDTEDEAIAEIKEADSSYSPLRLKSGSENSCDKRTLIETVNLSTTNKGKQYVVLPANQTYKIEFRSAVMYSTSYATVSNGPETLEMRHTIYNLGGTYPSQVFDAATPRGQSTLTFQYTSGGASQAKVYRCD